jgi:flagellar basal-body rod protein FlgF
MQSGLYVGLSATIALEKRLETIANNVANVGTAGFRADAVKFEAVLSRSSNGTVAFASPGENYISRHMGGITKTDNPLDVAVAGDGWFAFQTPQGIVYTRDGRMQMTAEGELRTISGYPILDPGGANISIDPSGSEPWIGADGTIQQDGRPVGSIGVFQIARDAKLTRFENSGVIPDQPAVALIDDANVRVLQGHTEGSNVNPILELTKLITVQRTFQQASAMLDKSGDSLEKAIRTLGETS